MKDNINSNFELNDNELEAVSGGVSENMTTGVFNCNTINLSERKLSPGSYVTCTKCRIGFQVSQGCCPCCGGYEVWHGIQGAKNIYTAP